MLFDKARQLLALAATSMFGSLLADRQPDELKRAIQAAGAVSRVRLQTRGAFGSRPRKARPSKLARAASRPNRGRGY